MNKYIDIKGIITGLAVTTITGTFVLIFFTDSLDIIIFILILTIALAIVFCVGFVVGKLRKGPEWLSVLLEHWNKTKTKTKTSPRETTRDDNDTDIDALNYQDMSAIVKGNNITNFIYSPIITPQQQEGEIKTAPTKDKEK